MAVTNWNKIWVIITLCSLTAYNLRWLYGVSVNISHIIGFAEPAVQVTWWRFWVDYVLTGLVGDVIRLAGAFLALLSVHLMWKPKPKPFSSVKKHVAVAILCEGAFFLTLLPITLIALASGVAPILMFAYTLQILLVSPVLMVLSRKIWVYTEHAKTNTFKWASVAAVSYLVGIWVNNVFSWLNVAATAGVGSILSGVTLLGFLNSVITLSLSLVFAVAGVYTLLRKADGRRSIKLFAFALIMLGLHFAVFILYSAVANTLNSVFLVEIWPVTFLGLGLGMLKGET
jgi:hypothetical protein